MKTIQLFLVTFGILVSAASHATLITVDPASDGSLYTCASCNTVSDGAYVSTGGYIQGDVKFSTAAIAGDIQNITLTLNPYGLPLYGLTVGVYGYGTSIGQLDVSDANAGTFLGNITLLSNLGYGQDVYFDVTNFVKSVSSPYVAFNLRSVGTDVFSSLEYNYGHPSQLLVNVPEPSALALLGLGLLVLGIQCKRREKVQAH